MREVRLDEAGRGLAGLVGDLVEDLIAVCREGKIVHVNAAGRAMLAGTAADARIDGEPLRRFIKAEFLDVVDDGLDLLLSEPSLPLMMVRADGEAFEVELTARTAVDETGAPLIVVRGRDLKDKVRAVNGLVANHKRLVRVVDQSLDLICLIKGGLITFLNPAGAALLQADAPADVLGKPLADLMHPDYVALMADGLADLAREREMVPMRVNGLKGRRIDVEIRVSIFRADGQDAYMVEARDITQRKRAAEGVREREQRLAGILGHVGEGIFTTGSDGLVQSFNLAAESMFGYQAAVVVGQPPDRLVPGATDRFLASTVPVAPRRRKNGVDELGREVEMTGVRADGSTFPMTVTWTRLPQGKEMLHIAIVRDITERKRAEARDLRYRQELETRVTERTRELNQAKRQNELILNATGDGIVGLDLRGTVIFANPAAAHILHMPLNRLHGAESGAIFRLRAEDGKDKPMALTAAELRDGIPAEWVMLRATGETFHTEVACTPLEDAGQTVGSVVVFRDITERRNVQARLQVAYTVFDTIGEGLLVCGADWGVRMVNPAFTRITGIPAEDAVAASVRKLLLDDNPVFEAMVEGLRWSHHWEREFWRTRPDGRDVALRVAVTEIRGGQEPGCHAIVLTDVTQRKRDEERIRYQANYDALTGLPNRSLFMDRLNSAVAQALRLGRAMALLFVDLDGFKEINDTLGHDAGDLLLKEVGARLVACARDSDTVARLGGDEFTVILTGVSSVQDAVLVAERLLDALAHPFDLEGSAGQVSASIGIALVPTHALDTEEVLNRADRAMYSAKQAGKAGWRVYGQDAGSVEALAARTAAEG